MNANKYDVGRHTKIDLGTKQRAKDPTSMDVILFGQAHLLQKIWVKIVLVIRLIVLFRGGQKKW
jgi:hypothetical protein